MSAGIEATDGMMSVRETPWHGLGVVLPEAPDTMSEAFRIAAMDWDTTKVPVYAKVGGVEIPVEGYAAVIRTDNNAGLSVMGEDYYDLWNTRIAQTLDGYTAQPGVKPETCGTLHDGRVGFALLSAGDGIAVPGDDSIVKGYLLASWSHDGTMKFTVRDTAVRVVCQNTLGAALRATAAMTSIKHTKGAGIRLDAYAERVAAAAAELDALGQFAAALAAAPFGREDYRTAADAMYPLPVGDDGKVKDGIQTERALNAQDAFLALPGTATVSGGIAGTAWGAYNAAVEVEDWLRGVSVNPDKRNLDPTSTYLRTIGGGRDDEKARALSIIASIAGVSI